MPVVHCQVFVFNKWLISLAKLLNLLKSSTVKGFVVSMCNGFFCLESSLVSIRSSMREKFATVIYHKKIARVKPDHDTAIRGCEPREQSVLPITAILPDRTRLWGHVCGIGQEINTFLMLEELALFGCLQMSCGKYVQPVQRELEQNVVAMLSLLYGCFVSMFVVWSYSKPLELLNMRFGRPPQTDCIS